MVVKRKRKKKVPNLVKHIVTRFRQHHKRISVLIALSVAFVAMFGFLELWHVLGFLSGEYLIHRLVLAVLED